MITPTGAKGALGGVVYAQIGPEEGLLAAGFYQLQTPQLNAIRDSIIANQDTFQTILDDLAVRDIHLNDENALKSMPRGYAKQADHPLSHVLRLKSYTVMLPQARQVWISGDIVERMVELAEVMAPLHLFGRDALSRVSD